VLGFLAGKFSTFLFEKGILVHFLKFVMHVLAGSKTRKNDLGLL